MHPLTGRRRAGAVILLLAAALLVGTGAEAAAPAEGLDKTYGVRGLATAGGPASAARRLDAEVSAKAPDGGLAVAGTQIDEAGGQRVTVARFTPTGGVDTSFKGGWVTFDTDPESYAGGVWVCDVVVQPDGAVLVSTTGSGTFQTLIHRFLPDGTRDSTFSGDGKLPLPGLCKQLTLRPDGRILTTAWATQPFSFVGQVVFRQLLADGRPDKSFDGDGERSNILTTSIMAPYEIFDVALQGDRIVVVGSASLEEDEWGSRPLAGFLARFTASGAPDKSFSGDGWLIRKDIARVRDVETLGSKVVVLGEDVVETNGTTTSVVGRLHGAADTATGVKAGQWDLSFSGDGVARRTTTYPQSVTVDAGGTVTALGHRTGYPTEALLWRYDTSGAPDTDYGGNGTAELSQCDGSLGKASCLVGVGVHAVSGGRVLVAGEALPCPDLGCDPPFNSENLYLPTRFAAMRTVADPLVAVFAETYSYVPEDKGFVPFSVRLTSRSVLPVTVHYETLAGSAQPGIDYTHKTGTVTFEPGQVTKVVKVPVIDDTVYEGPDTYAELDATPPEQRARRFTFRLTAETGTGGTVPFRDIKGAIVDNEFPPLASVTREDNVQDYLIANEGEGAVTVVVRLSHATSRPFWVEVDTVLGGDTPDWATPGEDFIALDNHRVNFEPGEVAKPVTVTLVDDTVAEEMQGFYVQAVAASHGHEFVGQFTAQSIGIADDDGS